MMEDFGINLILIKRVNFGKLCCQDYKVWWGTQVQGLKSNKLTTHKMKMSFVKSVQAELLAISRGDLDL